MTGNSIPVTSHTAGGSDRLTEEAVTAYLQAGGYGDEAAAVMAKARRFPCGYQYTADRHRYVVYIMPGGYWHAGDCAASEERIKSLGAGRRVRI